MLLAAAEGAMRLTAAILHLVSLRSISRRAAVLVLMLWPSVALADSSQPQLLIQAGVVNRMFVNDYEGHTGAGGTVGLLWTPWKSGGMWAEAGVMDVSTSPIRVAVLGATSWDGFPLYGEYFQHWEASAGLIAVGSHATGGFLRAGLGAYRVQTSNTEQRVLVAVLPGHVTGTYTLNRWTMGGSLGAGLRFGSETMRALPTVEARVVLEPGGEGERNALFLLTGGIWFR